MKTTLALLAAFLVATVPAKAQTTNTDCQVIGNQISCRSSTQTAPPFAPIFVPPASPQAPLLTPQLAALAAERNRAAAEARGRDVERFTAELSSHDAWVNLKTGNSSHVRMSGDRIYVRRIVPPGESWSSNMECVPAPSPPGTWNCINYLSVSRWRDWVMQMQTCVLETSGKLTAVSLERMTGESDTFRPKDVNWGKCKVKKVERMSFTWIPRGTQR